MSQPVNGESFLTANVAGCLASGVTAFLTFPLDFLKTNQQLSNFTAMSRHNVTQSLGSIAHIMTGLSALATGAILKNFTRISSYNWASNFMAIDVLGDKKRTSAPRVVIAGAMSGFMETILIVPFERIKTTMIQNSLLVAEKKGAAYDVTGKDINVKHHGAGRRYISPHAYYSTEVLHQITGGRTSRFQSARPHPVGHPVQALDVLRAEFNATPAMSLLATVRQMYALEGAHAFTAGTMITFARQIGTSAAWFSTYSATRQLIDPHGKSQEPMWFSLNIGKALQTLLYVISACSAVAITQPLDVVKSHIQLKNGKLIYRDSLSTAYRLVARKGFSLLYAGAMPRGVKIAAHGSITALLYSYFEKSINVLGSQSVFTD